MKAPKKPKPLTAKKAAVLAREGKWEEALTRLITLSEEGDGAAAASSAELLAALERWAEFVPHAARFLKDPSAVYAGNVFTDLTRLVRRAARELSDESIITTIAATIPERWRPMRDATLLKDLVVPFSAPGPADVAGYEHAVADAQATRFKNKPGPEFEAHCFALARVFKVEDEMIRRYDPAWAWWDHAVDAARVIARRGDPAWAWGVLEPKLPAWKALDAAQAFPVVLLVDPWLAPVMTPERSRQLLGTPRSEFAG